MANKRFKRQEYARYKKLGIKWRRPRGKTSKMRRYEAVNLTCQLLVTEPLEQ